MRRLAAWLLALAAALLAASCAAPPPEPPEEPFASFPEGHQILLRLDLDAWLAHPLLGERLAREIANDEQLPNAPLIAALRHARRQEAPVPFPGRTRVLEIGIDSDVVLTSLRQARPGLPPSIPDLPRSRALIVLHGDYDPALVEAFLGDDMGYNEVGWRDGLRVWGAQGGPRMVVEPGRIMMSGRPEELERALDVRAGRRVSVRERPGGLAALLEGPVEGSPFVLAIDARDETRRDLETLSRRRPAANQPHSPGLVAPWGVLAGLDYLVVRMAADAAAVEMRAGYARPPGPPAPGAFAGACEELVGAFPLVLDNFPRQAPPMEATASAWPAEDGLEARLEWSAGSVPRISARDVLLALGMAR